MLNTRSIRISGIERESIVDGEGVRYVIFTQGCPHHCPGCHNPQTHAADGGKEISVQTIINDIVANAAYDPLIQGITFSGGEPFLWAEELAAIGEIAHTYGLDIWTYTGYTYEELLEKGTDDPRVKKLLDATDYLVDGPFVLAEKDLTLEFRGSRNQRIIHLVNGERKEN